MNNTTILDFITNIILDSKPDFYEAFIYKAANNKNKYDYDYLLQLKNNTLKIYNLNNELLTPVQDDERDQVLNDIVLFISDETTQHATIQVFN